MTEGYPLDPTYDELLRQEARKRAKNRYEPGTSVATIVAIEHSMESALRERGWQPDD